MVLISAFVGTDPLVACLPVGRDEFRNLLMSKGAGKLTKDLAIIT
jgi:hypothetical protein